MELTQIAIATFGLVAVHLALKKGDRQRRWAPAFGLASQPFWLYETASHEMWGMLLVSVAYTVVWGMGAVGTWASLRKT